MKSIVCDIDNTLSDTAPYWLDALIKEFGKPDKISRKEIIREYPYFQNVPWWQSEKALKRMDELIYDENLQKNFPLIDGVEKYLPKVLGIVNLKAYMTVRSIELKEITKYWLNKNKLPDVELITRTPDIIPTTGCIWKAGLLKAHYPSIDGIIEDSKGIIEPLEYHNYKGHLFLFSHEEKPKTDLNVHVCETWKDVYENIKKVYGK